MLPKKFFVSGISTEIGKTVCSAILVKALEADYWKPVQSGDLHNTDSMKVAAWNGLALPHPRFHPETHRLTEPMSPHASAEIDGVHIKLNDFQVPTTDKTLIIEGAGGLMVPLNEQDTLLDLMRDLQTPVILVSRNYLGSINHTLLSIAQLRQAEVPIAGVVFNGPSTPSTESIILQMTKVPFLFRIPELSELSLPAIDEAARLIKPQLIDTLMH
ncbi:dethiobiotin synthase [Lewinella cohaerens]|uniref:dethiobiotin synthase n=1 Tax=Lewinella cohaerens TaxID=70995 RepID=UPI00037BAFBA|nr:dethiobiotin synthase [Lewinella cohaerens]